MTNTHTPHVEQPGTESKRDGLSSKAWTALVAISLFFIVATWIVASLLTARPYPDPTARETMLAITRNAQPEPNAPNRYPELIEALLEFDEFTDQVANEELVAKVKDWPYARLAWEAVIDPESIRESDPDTIEQQAASIRRAVRRFSEEQAFDRINELLQSPNLAATYLVSSEAFENNTLLNPPGPPPSPSDTILPFLSSWRNFAQAVATCSRVAAENGNVESAARHLTLASRLPAALTRRTTAVEHLYGLEIVESISREFDFICARAELTPLTLTTLNEVLAKLSNLGDSAVAIDGARLSTRDLVFQAHTRRGRYIPSVGNQITSFSWPRDPIEIGDRLKDASGYLAPSRSESLEFADVLFDKYEAAAREPDPAARERLYRSVFDSITSESDRYDFLSQVFPDLEGFVESYWETRARITALGILLAMAEHRLDHGDWPETLDQLVPEYLESIPMNLLTGEPFEYDLEPGQPPSLERLGVDWDRR